MTILEIAPDARSHRTTAALNTFLTTNNAQIRRFIEIRDVVLHDGRVLPNRKLTHEVYDLVDGRTVKIEATSRYDGVSNHTCFGFKVIEVEA